MLREKIAARSAGIVTYGLSPPKRDTLDVADIAARQVARIATLPIDGVVVYDLQDEQERTSAPRIFPFLPTRDPSSWAHDDLAALAVPRIVYRCVRDDTANSLVAWLDALRRQPDPFAVLVGAPSGRARMHPR